MKYSFVIIAYNEAANIAACITSITALLELGTNYEILVVDDGSKDQTPAIMTELTMHDAHIKLLGDGQNHGRGFGRHQGVVAAQGDFIIMVDGDIVLPADWLIKALVGLQGHDVAGGIAVPDGDVAYVYRRFSLRPKTVMGTTTITGNNGIYRKHVFEKLSFDPLLREGEDFDFNHRSAKAGYSSFSVPGLTVEHQESKSFETSLLWLYQSGIGATRHLISFKQIRMPDISFAATVTSFVIALIFTLTHGLYGLFIIPLLGIIGASFLHLYGKFYVSLHTLPSFAVATGINSLFIAGYYIGRLVGFGVYAASLRRQPSGTQPS